MQAGVWRWFTGASNYVRTAAGVRAFLQRPLTDHPLAVIRDQVENREPAFLDTLRRVVFSSSDHPYREMFRLARCSHEDVAALVRNKGLEDALRRIREAGVYLTQEEFKGNRPIVREGREIPGDFTGFRNPLITGTVRHVSSGSRGRATQTFRSAQFLLHQEVMHELVIREFGLQGRAQIIFRPTLPSALGLQDCAFVARRRQRLEGWYSPGASGLYAPATAGLVLMARVSGCRIPFPTVLQDNDYTPAATCVAKLCAQGVACLVSGPVSPAVRLAAAALDGGLNIAGTIFLVSGETLTDAKRAVIEQAGGKPFARYGISELGFIGHGCREMTSGDCVHLYSNAIAAITHHRPAPHSDSYVDSLFYTTLLPTAPLILINFEVNDHGSLERAECDCEFSRAGFHWRIRDVFSFGKMTGHGVTIAGKELIDLIENVLPARLGGRPGDYQLLEREGAAQTKLELRVSSRVGAANAESVRQCFLDHLPSLYGGSLAERIWRHAEAVEVIFAEPIATATGKVYPLRLLGERPAASSRA